MKALPLLVRKLWPRLKFFERRSNVKVTRSNFFLQWKCLVTRNVHTCILYESPTSSGEETMAKVKVFLKVGQMSRSRSQGQKFCYP